MLIIGKAPYLRCPRAASVLFVCILGLSVAACGGQSGTSKSVSASPSSADSLVPLRMLNPKPTRAYEIRMEVEDAPRPFANIEGVAQYDVQNPQCGDINPVIGAIPPIRSNEVVQLRKISEREYVGVVYADRIMDEDYYGNGVCHWALTEVRVALRGMDTPESSRFVATMPAEMIQAGGEEKKYYWTGYYPRAERTEGFPDYGEADLSQIPESKHGEFFIMSLTSRGLPE